MADTNESVEEGIDEIWKDDKLNRRAEAEKLTEYLLNRFTVKQDSFVLNLDAEWGFGKTFFLERWKQHLEVNKQCEVVYFNAWKSDFHSDPLVSFIAAVESQLEGFISKNKVVKRHWTKLIKEAAPTLIGAVSKKLTGIGIDEWNETTSSDSIEATDSKSDDKGKESDLSGTVSTIASTLTKQAIEQQKLANDKIDVFIDSIKQIALIAGEGSETTGATKPLFIFVDELDRCRPTYAIELLEIIKHLFEAQGIYFVVSTDSEQLSEAIRSVYGLNFDARRYLQRFFHQTYQFESISGTQYITYLWESNFGHNDFFLSFSPGHGSESQKNIYLLSKIATAFEAGLRDIEQAVHILDSISLLNKNREFAVLPLGVLIFSKICVPEVYKNLSKLLRTQGRKKVDVNYYHGKIKNYPALGSAFEYEGGHTQSLLTELMDMANSLSGDERLGDPKKSNYISYNFYHYIKGLPEEKRQHLNLALYPLLIDTAGNYLLKL